VALDVLDDGATCTPRRASQSWEAQTQMILPSRPRVPPDTSGVRSARADQGAWRRAAAA